MKICLSCFARFQSEDWNCPKCHLEPQRQQGHYCFAPAIQEGFEPHFFTDLERFEAHHFWFEARNRVILWVLESYCASAQTFLEIGCGTGFVLQGIHHTQPHVKLFGSELFTEGLGVAARRLPEVTLFQMDARVIPYESEFDVIGAFDVLEHIPEDELVLAQMRQAVKPGGHIIISVPQHRFLWSVVDDYSHHQRRYNRQELISKVQKARFKVKKVTSFVTLLMPLMLLSRLATRHQTVETYDPAKEFSIYPPLNRLLLQLMYGEAWLIRQGLSLPIGGSLLLVAEAI